MATMAPLSPAARDAAGERYLEVKQTIEETVRRFHYRYGGDLEELQSEASMAYMLGFNHVMQGKSTRPFEAEIRLWVWYELFDRYRTKNQHRRQVKVVVKQDEFIEMHPAKSHTFCALEFLDALSGDAAVIAALVLDTPADLAAACRARGGTDNNFRALIRQRLVALGWLPVRIKEAFNELQTALG